MITTANDEYCYDLSSIDLKGVYLIVNESDCFIEVKDQFFPINATTNFRKVHKQYILSNGTYELGIPEEQFQLIKELLPF